MRGKLEKRLEEVRNEKQDLISKGKTLENILNEIQYKVISLNSKEEELTSLLKECDSESEDASSEPVEDTAE